MIERLNDVEAINVITFNKYYKQFDWIQCNSNLRAACSYENSGNLWPSQNFQDFICSNFKNSEPNKYENEEQIHKLKQENLPLEDALIEHCVIVVQNFIQMRKSCNIAIIFRITVLLQRNINIHESSHKDFWFVFSVNFLKQNANKTGKVNSEQYKYELR